MIEYRRGINLSAALPNVSGLNEEGGEKKLEGFITKQGGLKRNHTLMAYSVLPATHSIT